MQAIYAGFNFDFLYVERYKFSEKWVYPPDLIPYAIYRYILTGRAVFVLNGAAYHVEAGDVFYIPQGSELSCEALEQIEFISVRFVGSVQIPGADVLKNLWGLPTLCSFRGDPRMQAAFLRIYEMALSDRQYKILEIKGYLNLITAWLAASGDTVPGGVRQAVGQAAFPEPGGLSEIRKRAYKSVLNHDPRITVILDYLLCHPEKNVSIEEMCQMAEVSESTLRRLFRARTGKTVYAFVRDNKMLNAARMLIATGMRISSIAYQLGYESPCYFGKCFKEVFGVSPQQYRKNSREL